jgi:AcrR family transcriptional regulator
MTTPTRRWARTDATQQRILDAATEVFGNRGFSSATMADIVAGSGASIGSIYHHFGGKKELFLAIYDRLSANVELRIAEAARDAAELDSQQAFAVHARAYLTAIWENRQAAMMMASGDVPADFERLRRSNTLSFFRRWMGVLDDDASRQGQMLSRVLIAILTEASLTATTCDDFADVAPISDAMVEWIARLRA